MPYHVEMTKTDNPHMKLSFMKDGKKKTMKLPEPFMKAKKMLSKRQKDLMKTHSEHHSKEHLELMKDLMKKGFCFEQSHELAGKAVGK